MFRRSYFAAGLFAAMAFGTLACSEVPPDNPFDPEAPETVQARGELTGRVLTESGPAEGAQVSLLDTAHTAVTGPDGTFALTDIAGGAYTIVVELDGYRRLTQPGISVGRGDTVPVGELALVVATGSIEGTVSLDDDAPVAGARVRVADSDAETSVDADGRFFLRGVPVGARSVVAQLSGYRPATSPTVTVEQDATVELEAPLVLERWPGAVTGRIVLPADDESAPADIEVGLAGVSARAATDAEGRFRLDGVTPGVYALVVEHPGYRIARLPIVVEAAYGTDRATDIGDIRLEFGVGALSGRVALADGETPSGVTVELVNGPQPGSAITNEAGEFVFDDVRAGAYRVRASRFGYATLEAPYTVVDDTRTDGNRPAPMALELDVRLGIVCGRLVFPDDDIEPPMPGGEVECPAPDGDAATLADADVFVVTAGGARFGALADGTFRVEAQGGFHTIRFARVGFEAVVRHNVFFDPAAPAGLGPIAMRYARGGFTGEVRIERCDEGDTQVSVRAEGPDTALALVTVPGRDEESNPACATPGVFELPGLRAGVRYRLVFAAEDHRNAEIDAEVEAGVVRGVPEVLLALDPGSIEGSVEPEPNPRDPDWSLAGSEVSVIGTDLSATTDDEGRFAIAEVPPGTFTVQVRRPGDDYEVINVPVVSVLAGRATRLEAIDVPFARGGLEGSVEAESIGAAQNALVTVSGPSPGFAVTDTEGHFQLFGLRVGTYTVRVNLDGYATQSVLAEVRRRETTALDPIVLPIDPGVLTGAVLPERDPGDADWTPAGTQVQLVGSELGAVTDDDGRFTLGGVPAGTYALRAVRDDAYDVVTVPVVVVLAGQQTDLDPFELPFARGHVQGRVEAADGGPVENALLTLDGPSPGLAFADANGGYQFFDVRVGGYTVRANLDGYRTAAGFAEVRRDEAVVVEDLLLEVNPGAVVGRVEVPVGDPGGARVRIVGTEHEAIAVSAGEVEGRTAGWFRIADVRGGTYSLVIDHGADFRTRALPNVQVTPGGETELGAIALDLATGRVTVDVGLDDRVRLGDEAFALAVTGVRLALTSLDGARAFQAVPGADGRAVFNGVRVGDYQLTARHADYDTVAIDGISVAEDGAEVVVPELLLLPIRPGRITGAVIFEDRTMEPSLVDVAVVDTEIRALTGADGTFNLPGLKAGVYGITLIREGFTPRTVSGVTVIAGGRADIGTIELQFARGGLSGTVRTTDGGEPLGALVAIDGPTRALARVESDGDFAFPSVPVGGYTVRVSLDAYVAAERAAEVVADGSTVLDDLVLAIDPGRIVGQIALADADGDSPLGARVAIPGTDAEAIVDGDGAFAIEGLRAGRYALEIAHTAAWRAASVPNVSVAAGGVTDLGRIDLVPAVGEVAIEIDLEDAADLDADAFARAMDATRLTLSTLDGARAMTATPDAEGEAVFADVRVGDWQLAARHADYQTATVEGIAVAADGVVVTLAEAVRLDIRPGSINGAVVLEDRGLAPVDVDVELAGGAARTETDAEGGFALNGLKAGVYTLSLRRDGFVTQTLAGVAVAAGGAVDVGTVELRFARGGLEGLVRTEDGADPTGALVEIDGPVTELTLLDADGAYAFPSVPVGDYTVRATLDAYVAAERAAVAAENAQTAVEDLVLAVDPGRITGVVSTADGTSPAGARITIAGTDAEAVADAEGAFVIDGLKAGAYALAVTHGAAWRSHTLSGVDVPAGGDISVGELTLEAAMGTVLATVALGDGEDPSGVRVTLTGDDGSDQAFADADGAVQFDGVRVGTYSLEARRDDYAPAIFQPIEIAADGDTFDVAEVLTLAVAPGEIVGTVVLQDFDGDADGVRVQVAGADDTAVTDAAGAFSLSLKAGTYTLSFTRDAGGFESASRSGVAVTANGETDIGAVQLPYATGALEGTVTTSDDASPSGAVVSVEGEGRTVRAIVDAAGGWQTDDLRVGSYVVTAAKPDYQSESANVTVVADQTVTVAAFALDIDPGSVQGEIFLVDADEDVNLEQALVTVQQTGDVAAVTPVDGVAGRGTFVVSDLAPGVYTISFVLDGYETRELSGVEVDAGAIRDLGMVVLIDDKAPDAPSLELVVGFTPLSGLAETPAVIATRDAALRLDPDGTDPAETDSNFDPARGRGRWEVRVSGSADWRPPFGNGVVPPPYIFEFENLRPGLNVLQVRAVDASGNIGTEGELVVVVDGDGPPTEPILGEPQFGCVEDPDAEPRRCVASGDALNLPLLRQSLDGWFGCYFLAEIDWPPPAPELLDPSMLDYDPVDGDCYANGTQFITVFPTASTETLYCVRAYDQSGQASEPHCMRVAEDSEAPDAPDLYPDGVEVRTLEVEILTDTVPETLDTNFFYYETLGSQPGARWQRTVETGPFTFFLMPGADNTLSVRAVDRAGNRGEIAQVTVYETTVTPAIDDIRGMASSPEVSGTMLMWAQPNGCDTTGRSRQCRHVLRLLDRQLPDNEPVSIGDIGTCSHDCPSDGSGRGGARTPILRQSANGVLFTSFVEDMGAGADTHQIYYWSFGTDGLPNGQDPDVEQLSPLDAEGPVIAAAANERLLAHVRFVGPGEPAYRIYTHAVSFDPDRGAAALILDELGEPMTIEADVPLDGRDADDTRPVQLGVYQKTVWYVRADGSLWIWTDPANVLSVHERFVLPPDLGPGARVRFVVPDINEINLVIEDVLTGAWSIHPMRFQWDRIAGPAQRICNCDDDQGCYGGYCATWPGELVRIDCDEPGAGVWCGEPTALDSDGPFVAWTATATDEVDGNTLYKLVTMRLVDNVDSPSLIVMRRQPLDAPSTYLDSIAYLDESSGAPRLYLADPTEQRWLAITRGPNEPKAFLEAGDDHIVIARYEPDPDRAGYDNRSGLYTLSIDSDGHESAVPQAAGTRAAKQQGHWAAGNGYHMQRTVFVAAALEAVGDAFTVTAYDVRTDPWTPIYQESGVTADALDVVTSGRDLPTIAWSGTSAGNEFGLRIVEIGVRADPGDDQTFLVGDRDCTAFDIDLGVAVCAGSDADVPFLRIFRAGPGNNWDLAQQADLSDVARGALDGGVVVGLWINFDELVIETWDNGASRLSKITAGDDRLWGNEDDFYQPLYTRTGDDLGRPTVLNGQLVFADESLTQQPEILRIRLSDGKLDRVTSDDAIQHHPALSPRGIFYVDHRYTATASGEYIFPPAITFRSHP